MTDNNMPNRSAGARPEWRIGDRIRRAREFAGLEQRELAERAGISQATISAAETGRARPHRSTVVLIAAATGVSYEWLADDEPLEGEPTLDTAPLALLLAGAVA